MSIKESARQLEDRLKREEEKFLSDIEFVKDRWYWWALAGIVVGVIGCLIVGHLTHG